MTQNEITYLVDKSNGIVYSNDPDDPQELGTWSADTGVVLGSSGGGGGQNNPGYQDVAGYLNPNIASKTRRTVQCTHSPRMLCIPEWNVSVQLGTLMGLSAHLISVRARALSLSRAPASSQGCLAFNSSASHIYKCADMRSAVDATPLHLVHFIDRSSILT